MQKVTPCFWFDDRIDEAVDFYVSVFGNARIIEVKHYGNAGPLPKGKVLPNDFELEGLRFIALNGGTKFDYSPALSMLVICESQAEVDHFWDRLSEGGQQQQCGWLQDRYGVSWQIVPNVLGKLLNSPDAARAVRSMKAMLQKRKLDVASLTTAAV